MELQQTARRAIATKYTITGRINTHGRSKLYNATQADSGRVVVLREFEPTDATVGEALGRLSRMAAVSSRFLADLVDVATLDQAALYVAHALLEGEALTARMARKGRFPPAEAAQLCARVLKGLDALHRRDLVHGGLRPSRVFHEKHRQRGWHVKLLSAGVATVTRDEARADMDLVRYSPPEWLAGAAWTPPADVWCVGAILFECLATTSAFDAKTPAEVARRIADGKATPLDAAVKDLPPDLGALLAECLAVDPAKRPPDAGGLLDRLLVLYPEEERDRRAAGGTTQREHWTNGRFVGRPAAAPLALPPVQESRTQVKRRERRAVSRATVTTALFTGVVAVSMLASLYVRNQRREQAMRDQLRRQDVAAAAVAARPQTSVTTMVPLLLPVITSVARPAPPPPVAPPPGPPAGSASGGTPTPGPTSAPRASHPTVHAVAPDPGPAEPGPAASGDTGMLQFSTAEPCQFMIDGSNRGEVTSLQFSLGAGAHAITCHSSSATHRLNVRVMAGRVTHVRLNSLGETEVYTEELSAPHPTP